VVAVQIKYAMNDSVQRRIEDFQVILPYTLVLARHDFLTWKRVFIRGIL